MGAPGEQRLPRDRPQISSPRIGFNDHRASQQQRVRYQPPHRSTESTRLMTVSVLHTSDAWWRKTPNGAAKIDTAATTTAQLLADHAAIEAAAASTDIIAVDSRQLISP